jgi:CoA-transferase family III
MTGVAALPLTGLRIIAVEQAVAAPFCTARLADAGARIIRYAAALRHCTVIGLATRGIMMIESCRVIVPTEK